MNSLYFINAHGVLTSNHNLAVEGIKAYSNDGGIHTLLFSLHWNI